MEWKGFLILQDRRELPEEEGDVIREYKAMHEEKILSCWLREDGKEKKERTMEIGKESTEEMGKKRRREEEKDENETGSVKRLCVGSLSVEAFDIFSQGRDLERCGGLSWSDLLDKPEDMSDCEPETRVDVPDVADVPVSPSLVVTEFCDGCSCCSDREFVEPHSFSFSKKRAHSWTVTQEEMRCEVSQVKAPPLSGKRMMLPLHHGQIRIRRLKRSRSRFEVQDQIWSARDRTVIARTKQYLEESKSLFEGAS